MRGFKSFGLVACVVLMSASVAFAQAPVTQTSPFQRGYMTGTAGASFGGQQTATFGVELADHINRHVQAFVSFNYFDDLITDSAQSGLDDLGATLTRLTATPWEFAGHDRDLLFSGGAKYLFANGSNVRPYLAAPGVLNLRRTIVETHLGEISDEVLAIFGATGGVIDAAQESTYKPTVEFLAGVGIAADRRTYVDVGYRYRRVFKTDEPLRFSQFNVGVGMRF